MHTTHSDGVLSVPALVALLGEHGVSAAVLTDHDTTKGSDEFREQVALLPQSFETFTGVEMSVGHHDKERHILAYFWQPKRESPAWQAFSDALQAARRRRREHLPRYLKLLNDLGMPLEQAEVLQFASEETVGRPHIARAMIARGYVTSVNDAFDRFLGTGKPAFILREYASAEEMIRLATAAGAVTSLAHPWSSKVLREELEQLVSYGLAAVEAHHPSHDPGTVMDYLRHAHDLRLLVTGGSDFHGGTVDGRGTVQEGAPRPGSCGLQRNDYERLRNELQRRAAVA